MLPSYFIIGSFLGEKSEYTQPRIKPITVSPKIQNNKIYIKKKPGIFFMECILFNINLLYFCIRKLKDLKLFRKKDFVALVFISLFSMGTIALFYQILNLNKVQEFHFREVEQLLV